MANKKRRFLVDLDLNNNELLNASLQNLSAHPSTNGKKAGWVYWNTTDETAYAYTGIGNFWLDLGGLYTHPNVGAIDSTLTGAKVVAKMTTNAQGHVLTFSTRDMTPGDIGTYSKQEIDDKINNIESISSEREVLALDHEILGNRDGVNSTFSMPSLFIQNTTKIYLNGVLQESGVNNDYIELEDGYVSFNFPILSTDKITANYKII